MAEHREGKKTQSSNKKQYVIAMYRVLWCVRCHALDFCRTIAPSRRDLDRVQTIEKERRMNRKRRRRKSTNVFDETKNERFFFKLILASVCAARLSNDFLFSNDSIRLRCISSGVCMSVYFMAVYACVCLAVQQWILCRMFGGASWIHIENDNVKSDETTAKKSDLSRLCIFFHIQLDMNEKNETGHGTTTQKKSCKTCTRTSSSVATSEHFYTFCEPKQKQTLLT